MFANITGEYFSLNKKLLSLNGKPVCDFSERRKPLLPTFGNQPAFGNELTIFFSEQPTSYLFFSSRKERRCHLHSIALFTRNRTAYCVDSVLCGNVEASLSNKSSVE